MLAVAVIVVARVAVSALPVTSPVKSPANNVAVNKPLLELNVKLEPLLGGKSPVAAVANNGKQVVSLDSSATVTAVPTDAKATAIFPVPSKLVPPIKSRGAMAPGAWMTGFYIGETYLENNVLSYFENRFKYCTRPPFALFEHLNKYVKFKLI